MTQGGASLALGYRVSALQAEIPANTNLAIGRLFSVSHLESRMMPLVAEAGVE